MHKNSGNKIIPTQNPANGDGYTNAELTEQLTELQKANKEVREARRAALNLMEDAILSKERLRINEARMRRQKEAFQAAVNGAPLHKSLSIIAQIVTEETKARTAFYIADEKNEYLHPMFDAGTMPENYLKEIDNFPIGEDSLACGLAVPTLKPVVTPDVFEEPRWKSWTYIAEKYDYRGCWSFPIKTRDNKAVGTFAMYFTEPRQATASDLVLVEIVTDTAAVIISNSDDEQKRIRAEKALRESEERKEFLLKLNDTIRELNDPVEIQYEAARLVAEELKADRVHFAEISDGKVVIQKDYVRDNIPSIAGTFEKKIIAMAVKLEREEPVVIADTQAFPLLTDEEKAILAAAKIRSQLSVALSKRGKKVASFSVDQTTPREWKPFEVSLLQEAAERTLAAVERAKVEEALTKELEDAKLLQQISNRIIEKDNVHDLYDALLVSAMDIMDADFASIQLLIPDKNELYLLAYKNFHPDSAKHWEYVKIGSPSSSGQASLKGEKVVIQDIENSVPKMNKDDYDAYHLSGIAATQSTPLVSRSGNQIGLISTHWKQIYHPSEHQFTLLDVIVRQASDLIERKNYEEAVKNNEERLRVTFESAVDFSIVNINEDGIIEGWNSGAERIFEYKSNEILGKPLRTIFSEKDRDKGIPEKEMETAKKEGFASYERWHQRKDGSRLFLSGVLRPIYDPQFTGFVKITRDMTEKKLLEQQKEDFIGIASHELKTPVTSIKAYAELLFEMFEENKDAASAEMLKKLNGQVDRLIGLIHALLDTSKIAEGDLPLDISTFDLNDLIEERIEDLQRLSPAHHLIKSKAKTMLVTADHERMGQVLTNLISNAVKYSPDGGDIVISCIKEKDEIQVSIKDSGIGISEEAKQKLFTRFFRASDVQSSTFPGMGLGLYVTANIVRRHGGKIWVESTQGKGSTFYFSIPDHL